MTFKKPTRAGLAAVVIAVLLGIFLSVPSFTHSYAQAPATARQQSLPPKRRPMPGRRSRRCRELESAERMLAQFR